MKQMVHGIHAGAMREKPLQIVGFRGFNTYVFEEPYPGNLANCVGCHTDEGYTLPLASGVLGTTVDTGASPGPDDDKVVSPATAVCSSYHDGDEAAAHMVTNGGSFSTTQQAIDSGEVVEQCTICHGSGAVADVARVHGVGN